LQVDPLAEKYPGWSPYNYVVANPLRYIDPKGMDVSDWYDENGKFITHIDDGNDVVAKTNKSRSEIEKLFKENGNNDYILELSNSIAKGDDEDFWLKLIGNELSDLSASNPEVKNVGLFSLENGLDFTGRAIAHGSQKGAKFLRESDFFSLNFNVSAGRASTAWGTRGNIISNIVHELGHVKEYLTKRSFNIPELSENYAFDFQKNHSSWSTTTEKYKDQAKIYIRGKL